MRAFSLIRAQPHYRADAFAAGLAACGFAVHGQPRGGAIDPDDVLLIWNRYGRYAQIADQFEDAGAEVIVAENGLWGRDWIGGPWYSLALSLPAAVGGGFSPGGASRWASWDIPISPYRERGGEIVVLAQRGIGPRGYASPSNWHDQAAALLAKRYPLATVRIRQHPGEFISTPLLEDLSNAIAVVTWGSGAALKASLAGHRVFHGLRSWCGWSLASNFIELSVPGVTLMGPARARLPTFERLAWTTWTTTEIATGEPFRRLLGLSFPRALVSASTG